MTKLSIIVPIYNEESHLEASVKRLLTTTYPIEREFIFVNDGSTDKSSELLSQLAELFDFDFITMSKNQGKGAAIRQGLGKISGDLVMIQDADFEYDPNDVPSLLQPILEDRADVVYGSRFKHNTLQVHRTYHYFVNRFLTLLSNLLSGIYLSDMETCYKIFRSDLMKSMNLTSNRFGIEVELTACVSKTSARIYELPISYHPRTQMQGKKIGWKDGVAALYHLLYFNIFRSEAKRFNQLPSKYHSNK
jgi:glycosyltransferase involved in cell wall biosynthesis